MINTIIFDLGGVLIKWDPTCIFQDHFNDKEELSFFFENVCTMEWNEQQDAGRTVKQATEIKIREYPEYEAEIRMYYDRWTEMIRGSIAGTVSILENLYNGHQYRLLALTNWSAELFPYARKTFPFLKYFEGILVSGEEKMKKPEHRIYKLLLNRYNVVAEKAVFIDDNIHNVVGASEVGLKALHFKSPEQLVFDLNKLNIIV